jgi:hypothetical protein
MSEEMQQPDLETPDRVRSPQNTERDLESENTGDTDDSSETVKDLVSFTPEADDSPKNDRPIDLKTLAQTVDAPEVMRKPPVIDPLAYSWSIQQSRKPEVMRKPPVIDPQPETDGDDRSPKNDRGLKA